MKIEQVDNATRTARYRAGDFPMRASLWTDDIADPSEITSYFAYFPNIQSLHSGYEDKTIDKLFEAVAEGDRTRPSAPTSTSRSRRST